MKLVRVTATIEYEEIGDRGAEFEREFESFSLVDSNPIEDFIQKMKAKDAKNIPDQTTLALLIALHKKIDGLTRLIAGEKSSFVSLKYAESIDYAWFDAIKLDSLKSGLIYYGRVKIPLLNERFIPIFFEAKESQIAAITKILPSDKTDLDGYLASKDREEIARGKAQ